MSPLTTTSKFQFVGFGGRNWYNIGRNGDKKLIMLSWCWVNTQRSHKHGVVCTTWDDMGFCFISIHVQFGMISDPLNPILERKWGFITTADIKGRTTCIFDLVCCWKRLLRTSTLQLQMNFICILSQIFNLRQLVCSPKKAIFLDRKIVTLDILFTYKPYSFQFKLPVLLENNSTPLKYWFNFVCLFWSAVFGAFATFYLVLKLNDLQVQQCQ